MVGPFGAAFRNSGRVVLDDVGVRVVTDVLLARSVALRARRDDDAAVVLAGDTEVFHLPGLAIPRGAAVLHDDSLAFGIGSSLSSRASLGAGVSLGSRDSRDHTVTPLDHRLTLARLVGDRGGDRRARFLAQAFDHLDRRLLLELFMSGLQLGVLALQAHDFLLLGLDLRGVLFRRVAPLHESEETEEGEDADDDSRHSALLPVARVLVRLLEVALGFRKVALFRSATVATVASGGVRIRGGRGVGSHGVSPVGVG